MNENVLNGTRGGKSGGWLHYFANPGRFMRVARPALPWLAAFSIALTAAGIIWGYQFAPADYAALAVCSLLSIVWRHPLADIAAEEIGPVGAAFTFVCLVSGSLWGRPMWGAYWVWDARLTSVLLLFFLYLGHIALIRAFDNKAHGYRAAAILALVGAINLPIIVFSVQWWNTLHQGNTISFSGGSKIYVTMLYPLLISSLGFYMSFFTLVVARICAAIAERKTRSLLLAAAEQTP
jgi:heme exporter protein C